MFRPATSPPHFPTLVLLTALSVLTLNMFLPSLANIARDLNTSYALASLAVSGFLAVNGVLQLVIGPLADRYGRRPILLWSMAIFVVASVVCALAEDIVTFLAARTVQAIIIAGSTLASAILSDVHGRAKAASLMGYLAMAMAVAPMLAPMVGGVLDEALGWRAGFWLYTGLGAITLWLIWSDLGETNPAPADTMWKQVQSYRELFGSRRFWGYTVCMACGIGVFFLFIASAPLVGQEVFGLSPTMVGVGIGSITGGFFLGSFITGRYTESFGPMRMILVGRALAVVGVGLVLIAFALGAGGPILFFAGAISAGFANGLSISNARAGALAVRPHLAGSASGLSGALTVALGAVLTASPGLLLTKSNGAWLTLVFMLILAIGAMAAAVYTWDVDRRETLLGREV